MKILLVDDHLLFGEALKTLLESISIVESVDFVCNGEKARQALKEKEYDLMFLDINLGAESGFEVFESTYLRYPELKIIALTSHEDQWTIGKAVELGFDGYLFKSDGRSEIEKALISINADEVYLSSQMHEKIKEENAKYKALTRREKEILKAICDGLSTKEIADSFFISIKTVETHRSKLFDKMDVRNVNELIKKAYSLNIISI